MGLSLTDEISEDTQLVPGPAWKPISSSAHSVYLLESDMNRKALIELERKKACQTVVDFVLAARKDKCLPSYSDLIKLAKRVRQPHSFHAWGTWEGFRDVEEAACQIGKFCRRWGRIGVSQTKEKYGTARVYCHFGWHQMFSITHPGYAYSRYWDWVWNLDVSITTKIFHVLRINALVLPYQQWIYRRAYDRAITRYPHIRDEILDGADWPEYLEGL
jgi:hypothetical protein